MRSICVLFFVFLLFCSCRQADDQSDADINTRTSTDTDTDMIPDTDIIRTDPLLSPHTYLGTIDQSGYHPPRNIAVVWRRPGSPAIAKLLNPAIQWSGQNAGDDAGYFGRYAQGDTSLRGAQIAAIGSEQKGGEASAILTVLLGRAPSNQELYDFAIANSPSGPMGCSAWLSITGSTRAGCTDTTGSSGDGLRLQPLYPPGCCSVQNPCMVDDPMRDRNRKAGEKWLEPVRTVTGGRRGCNLTKLGGDTVPTPTATPIATATPLPTATPVSPRDRETCWLLRTKAGSDPTLSPIACP